MNGGAVVCAMMGLDNVTNEIMIQDVFFGVDFVVFWHRELLAWPDLGHVKGVEAEFLGVGVLGLHDLDHGGPFDLLALFNRLP